MLLTYLAGATTGFLMGVSGTFLVLVIAGALPDRYPSLVKRIPSRWLLAFSVAIIVSFCLLSHAMLWGKTATTLLLLLFVLAASEIAGLPIGLFSSAVAALTLSLIIFPPIGSFWIEQPRDRLEL